MEYIVTLIGAIFSIIFNFTISMESFITVIRYNESVQLYTNMGFMTLVACMVSVWCLITLIEKKEVV